MKRLLIILIVFAICSCQSNDIEKSRTEILDSMKQSQDYWNSGDLEGFMHNYWKSDSLKFIGKSGITYGWQASLDRYLKSYPDKASQGRLEFEFLHLDPVENEHFFMVGKYTLYRSSDTLNGHYTLLWRKIDGKWKIVADHSS